VVGIASAVLLLLPVPFLRGNPLLAAIAEDPIDRSLGELFGLVLKLFDCLLLAFQLAVELLLGLPAPVRS